MFGNHREKTGAFDKVHGDLNQLNSVEFIDQNPIGKSSRSNPVTYVKAYDQIRGLFAEEQLSKINGFKPKHFSFNVEGGRCDECEGEGFVSIEMQFMADVKLTCENCEGKRFKDEILEVQYNGKNIYDVLSMTVEEAVAFFSSGARAAERKIVEKLTPLNETDLVMFNWGNPPAHYPEEKHSGSNWPRFSEKREHKKRHYSFLMNPLPGFISMISKN